MKPDQILRLYSEKFSRLDESSLIQFMTEPGWRFGWDMRANKPSEEARMPDLEWVEAYVLNLRFFIQKNELISWPRMYELYRDNCIEPECAERFEDVRAKFNAELDKKLFYKVNDQPITYREVFLGMIFSQIAHSNQIDKHALFNGMRKDSFSFHFNMDAFLRCIDFTHICLGLVNELNKRAFAYNKSSNSDASDAGAG